MRPGGRVQAAIEVLDEVIERHRPANVVLADWGRNHRFAGSGDRAAIGNLVFDALRKRASSAARLNDDGGRALALGALVASWGLSGDDVAAICDGSQHAPAPLSDGERHCLASPLGDDAPAHIRADVPEWLWPLFTEKFDEEAVGEGQAFAMRAPVDLRVNTLKADVDKVAKALARQGAKPCTISPVGLRIAPPKGPGRTPNVQVEAGFQRGWFEVQDEGSQVAAQLAFTQPGEQVLDFCAGAGGKTLALAASMQNKGQIFAYDEDKQRLAPIYERLKRAGVRNVQVRAPGEDVLSDLVGRMHRVVVDAPCTGSGVWRRRPDAKWRLSPEAFEARIGEQRDILAQARDYVRPGGYLCYITCSVLRPENEGQVYGFLEDNPDFELVTAEEAWRELFGLDKPAPWSDDAMTLTMTPASTGTDGFFFAVMERRGAV